jgi:ABC-2 type transport system permease protein
MRGFGSFLRKEFVEIFKTWRLWVLPGIVFFFALSGPIIAQLTPQLLESVAGSQPGVVFQIPDPTFTDSYLQWAKNLGQIVTFAIIIIYGGLVSAERKSGTAILVLTKPVSRPAFVVAKFVSQAVMLCVTVVVGALMTWGVTYGIFGEAPIGVLAEVTGLYLATAVMFLAMMTLFSVMVNSQAGAAGLGLGFFLLVSIASLWGPALEFSPAGLMNAPTELLVDSVRDLLWPLVTTGAVAVLSVAGGAFAFTRKEL